MKTVLLLTYSPRGTYRISGLKKYLPQFGWETVMLPEEAEAVAQRPNRFGKLGFAARIAGEFLNYPCPDKWWMGRALKEAEKIIPNVDAIYASSQPVSAHLVARQLCLKFGVPWIAELRDPWSQSHNYGYSGLRRYLDAELEIKTLQTAGRIITLSKPWADNLERLHNRYVDTVLDGFDPDEVNDPPEQLYDDYTTTYVGSVYPKKQNMDGLRRALTESRLFPNFRMVQGVGREESLEIQRKSHILVMLDWMTEKGVYTSKIFEYLAARRPIIAFGGQRGSVVDLLLQDTNAGYQIIEYKDLQKAFEQLFLVYTTHGTLPYSGVIPAINQYSQIETARRVAGVLNGD